MKLSPPFTPRKSSAVKLRMVSLFSISFPILLVPTFVSFFQIYEDIPLESYRHRKHLQYSFICRYSLLINGFLVVFVHYLKN